MDTTITQTDPEREEFYAALDEFLAKISPYQEPELPRSLLLSGSDEDSLFEPAPEWFRPGEQPGGWNTIRATFDRPLSASEVMEAAGCLGYALRVFIGAGPLSLPVLGVAEEGKTVVSFYYDSTKSQRWMPSVARAFAHATHYIQAGTPRRSTNRAGTGTAGTPLCVGIGEVGVQFHLR